MTHDPRELIVGCKDAERIIGAINALMPQLPVDLRRQLNSIKLGILQTEGLAGVHSRLNGRTVGDIVASESARGVGNRIETGQRDGIKFSLYESKDDS